MAAGTRKMISVASSLHMVTTLLWLSGLVQSQDYPACPQTGTTTELDRDAIQATSSRFLRVLEKFQNKPTEIVFVLDSSGSVGSGYFGCEVQFVRHFSKLFSVSEENSRIAVVTYSSCDRVYTDIDYITDPEGKNKCTFLGNDLPTYVTYRDGGTCTIDGLRRAQQILAQSRPSAKRIVFLLTDGHSNDGGSPLAVAQAIKDSHIDIFTVGLGGGISVEELDAIASSPTEDYRFLLDQLTDVESLATKLKGDERDKSSWDRNVSPYLCDSVCSQGHSCCDAQATCSCATQTGSYGCACHQGYRGDGKAGECQACPRGTYKDVYGNQDCEPCPDSSTTAVEGSISRDACECLPGHEGTPKTGGSCTPIKCVKLTFSDASGVLVVPPDCDNHFGVECHMQCRPNHRAHQGAADVRCLATGQWSAVPLTCTLIKCEILPQPGNGQLSCDTTDRSIGTVCDLTCNEGYEPEGSLQTQCNLNEAQNIGQWSNTDGRCNAKTCPILLAGKNMKIQPKSCGETALEYLSVCFYECGDGFQVQGVNLRTCQADGQWSNSSVENKCVDIEPPEFTTCPDDISLPTDLHLSFATNPASWSEPEAEDNDGEPVIEASPSATQERFHLGVETTITYTARDEAGLENTCTFSIAVTDEEAPQVISCPEDIEEQSSNRSVAVFWEEPVFKDNSGQDLTVITNRPSGSTFYWGLPEKVWFEVKDAAENNVSCEFTVSVKQYGCPFHPPPQNGALVCDNWLGGQFCRISCNDNFDFNRDPEDLYYCRSPPGGGMGEWGPSPLNLNPASFRMPWPQCTEKRDPSVEVGLELNFFTGDCQANKLEIKEDFLQKLQEFGKVIPGFCQESMGCILENVEVTCSPADQPAGRRRRQANNVLSIKFTVKVDAPEQAVDQMQSQNSTTSTPSDSFNSISILDNFMEVMDDIVSTGQLNITAGEGLALTPTGPLNVVRPVELLCELGEVLRNNSCIVCPSGTFHDVEGGICRDCSVGYYQDMQGQLDCQQCPQGTSTRRTTTISLEDCKEPCAKGTFSTYGLQTCKACPKGSYQPSTGSTSCQICPFGLTTWTEGAVNADECSGECPFGTYSSTGFSPCKPCPVGTYQPSSTQTLCIQCPDGLYTHRQGAHDLAYCQVINECEDDDSDEGLCGVDGLCIDLPKGYQCVCKLGFTGSDCRTNIDDCDHDLCLNNGTCVDLVGEYRCDCASGFVGIHCQEDINECESDPCFNRAVCIDGQNSYSCECAPGFTGDSCQVNYFDCASDPCLNDGTCVDLAQNFTCCCRPGFKGRLCETTVDHCDSSPCMNNATCIASFNSVSCTCQQGFTGKKCEVDINECVTPEQVVCRNGGTCQDVLNGFKCNCYPGYSGEFCEAVLLGDFDLTFPGASTSNYVMLKGNLPGLYAFTVTFWMQTTDTSNAGTPLSYAAYNADGTLQDNALTLSDYNSLAVIINGKFIYTDVKLNSDANWHHVGVTWAGKDGQWAIYVDGMVKRSGSDFQTGSYIRASGALILGQEQDSYAGSFAQTQAFVGGLTQLNIWDYAMTQEEIQHVYASCTVPGNVLTWSQVASHVHGGIIVSPTSYLCQAKTNCQSSTCNYNGVCTDLVDSFECLCNLGYYGTGCENLATSCSSSGMCLNGGSCHSNGSSLNCSCATGYTGERCEFMSDPCHSMVCLNGGSCESVEHQPMCDCPAGWKGRLCEYDIDECDSNNGGCAHECNNMLGSYYCRCSDGYVLQSDSHSCNDVSYCTHEGRFHLADAEWNFECSTCHCEQGTAVCEVKKCPELKCKENEQMFEAPGACCPECLPESKTCSVSIRGKYLSYDGNKFDNTGNCRYVLSQDCVGSQFSVEVQYEANKKKFFRRAVFLRLDCVEVEVNYNGMVKVTGVPVELPYTHAAPMNVMITRTNTSIDDDGITIKTNRGVIIRWSKKNDIEVSAPGTFQGALCGLCGNMNGNRKDDRTTRQFLPSRSAMEFAHSWKVDGYKHCSVAKNRGRTRQKFGAISINNIPVCAGKSFFVLKDIRKKCSLLRQRSFQMCHSVVDPNRYFEWCMQDACSCHSNEPCYCEAVSAYILECQRNHVAIKWTENSACNIRCPEGMIYDNCGPACLATCLNPTVDPAECRTTACVPRCQCPAGTVFHENTCVLAKYCPVITSND